MKRKLEEQKITGVNDARVTSQENKNIIELFKEQVNEHADDIALSKDGVNISYRELDQKSDRIALALQAQNIADETAIGLILDSSIDKIVSIIGVLKAGGAYVPIDRNYPAKRKKSLLANCAVKYIICNADLTVAGNSFTQIMIEKLPGTAGKLTTAGRNGQSLAYVLYTSGSSGEPKGVMVEDKSIIRLVKNTNYIDFSMYNNMLMTSNFMFDASTFEIWGSLLNGLKLHLIDQETLLNIRLLKIELLKQKIDLLWLTTPLFNLFAQQDPSIFNSLKTLIVGGDTLSVKQIEIVRQANPALEIINGYGPTENTTFSTTFKIKQSFQRSIPIGKPIKNSTAYIVHPKTEELQAMGETGELWVGGTGICRGYMGRPDLTGEKFKINPFGHEGRIYKTGDLARQLPDGNIEFLGRIDNQVKIRGFRIEPEEIKINLLKHNQIEDCVVIFKEINGNKQLIAFFISRQSMAIEKLKIFLNPILPEYMIPTDFVQLEKFPLTANGKIDKKQLLHYSRQKNQPHQVPAHNDLEKKLIKLWKESLFHKTVAATDHFLDLGGNSLLAMQLVHQINKQFAVDILVTDILNNITIKQLAKLISQKKKKKNIAIKKIDYRADYPLSSAQKRMYILQQANPGAIHYNNPFVYKIKGKIELDKLEKAFHKIIARHEILRSSFPIKNEIPVQVIHDKPQFKVEYSYYDEQTCIKNLDQMVLPFLFNQSSLMRVFINVVNSSTTLLIIDFHHIIIDGVSIKLFFKELGDLLSGKQLALPEYQYKDFCEWERVYKESSNVRSKIYWLNQLKGNLPILNLPYDYEAPKTGFAGNTIFFQIKNEIFQGITNLAKQNEVTHFTVLLAVYFILLYKITGQDDIIVGVPACGRPGEQWSKVIGMFVNTLPIRYNIDANQSGQEILADIKHKVLSAIKHQDYPFDDLVNSLSQNQNRRSLFETMFSIHSHDYDVFKLKDKQIKRIDFKMPISLFNLSFEIFEKSTHFLVSIEYNTSLFHKQTIKRMQSFYLNLVNEILLQPSQKIKNLSILSDFEKDTILEKFCHGTTRYHKEMSIIDLFQEQVKKTPAAHALVSNGRALTYRELNDKVNLLGRKLCQSGIKSGAVIGLMSERNFDLIIGILAILKSRAAYLPIDRQLPRSRINFMLKQSLCQYLLTDQTEDRDDFYCQVLNMKELLQDKTCLPDRLLSNSVNDPAYVIYTSGSTGQPKGVIVGQQSVINLACFMQKTYYAPLNRPLNISLSSPFYFDASIKQIFPALLFGHRLHLVEESTMINSQKLLNFYQQHKIDIADGTPATLLILAQALNSSSRLSSLKFFFIGGERLSKKTARAIFNYLDCSIVNVYGPTECCDVSTVFSFNQSTINDHASIPIGRPIDNAAVYILDKNKHLCAIGIGGEIGISGDNVALGYCNNEKETESKFIINPWDHSKKMYLTGDQGRWLPDGNIEFLGRYNRQIKLRGYRIELDEIETVMLEHNDLQTCCVEFIDGQIILFYSLLEKMYLRPSWAEQFVYDDMSYYAMTTDQYRNEMYLKVFRKYLSNKKVLEIGPGADICLTKLALEAGAKKVIAVEIFEDAFNKAKDKIQAAGLEDKVELILGDITKVDIDDKADYCISEITGPIGGMQGAPVLINSARSHLKNARHMIPCKSVSHIAAVTLPGKNFDYTFDQIGAHYTNLIFRKTGRKFDLRLCLTNFKRKNIISTSAVFEYLDYSTVNRGENEHDISLKFSRDSLFHGLIVWLELYLDEEVIIETLDNNTIWLPLYFPIFFKGKKVNQGDLISMTVKKQLAEDGVHPDFMIKGKIHTHGSEQEFEFSSLHEDRRFKNNQFYREVFKNEPLCGTKEVEHQEITGFLRKKLPHYMLPHKSFKLDYFPRNSNGKIDRFELTKIYAQKNSSLTVKPPVTASEKKMVKIWSRILDKPCGKISIDIDFVESGGDSLKAILLARCIKTEFKQQVEFNEIFQYSTISQLLDLIRIKTGLKQKAFQKDGDREIVEL